jgi:predicted aconitase
VSVSVRLSDLDRSMLNGDLGEATRFAMSVVVRMAEVLEAPDLISVEQAHIDACALMSQSNLRFVTHLAQHGDRVRVPTTLNMVSLDLNHWKELGVPSEFAEQATRIAEAYTQLGCVPTWTCAPYQGYLAPRFGQQIAWGESNAVVYANSVLGARTNRYADFMDVCAAVTARVPNTGLHRTENRRGELVVRLPETSNVSWESPAAWAVLGHLIGELVGEQIPVIEGLPRPATCEQLKALGAAAASSGGVAMYHAVGITPEAPDLETALHGASEWEELVLTREMLRSAWDRMSSAAEGEKLDAVILGCPHFSYAEFEALAAEIRELRPQRVHPDVQLLVLTHSSSLSLASRGSLVDEAKEFGATIVLDTCPFHSPIVVDRAQVVMTNSGKCAYYAPAELGTSISIGTLRDCVRAATTGTVTREEPPWDDS